MAIWHRTQTATFLSFPFAWKLRAFIAGATTCEFFRNNNYLNAILTLVAIWHRTQTATFLSFPFAWKLRAFIAGATTCEFFRNNKYLNAILTLVAIWHRSQTATFLSFRLATGKEIQATCLKATGQSYRPLSPEPQHWVPLQQQLFKCYTCSCSC